MSPDKYNKLIKLRKKLDKLDDSLIKIIKKRTSIVKQVLQLKEYKNQIIDNLIDKVISSKDREDLIFATRALDRVLLWNHYVIPQWHISSYRTLYWDIFNKPKIRPKYSLGTNTWWVDSKKIDSIDIF